MAEAYASKKEDYFNKAKQDGKLVLLDFGAPWCSTCTVVDRALEKAWPSLEKQLLWVKIDIHQEPELAERFDILSVPTILVLTPQENLLWRKSGTFQIEELLKALK